ncbi:hypothetical protein Nepgr_030121 [Nepenthes gracilis]|uniref:Uncharacterized protein n=1 Tax=Nepenthes gracilis TaxID=150966 RepID=A0AAD3TDX4_NEPGR|nr:hypothetical protein Nepgr_030121 [Nepenthes gracilis]
MGPLPSSVQSAEPLTKLSARCGSMRVPVRPRMNFLMYSFSKTNETLAAKDSRLRLELRLASQHETTNSLGKLGIPPDCDEARASERESCSDRRYYKACGILSKALRVLLPEETSCGLAPRF